MELCKHVFAILLHSVKSSCKRRCYCNFLLIRVLQLCLCVPQNENSLFFCPYGDNAWNPIKRVGFGNVPKAKEHSWLIINNNESKSDCSTLWCYCADKSVLSVITIAARFSLFSTHGQKTDLNRNRSEMRRDGSFAMSFRECTASIKNKYVY